MKSKIQKQEEMNLSKALLEKCEAVLFFDMSKVKTSDMKNLRQELKRSGNPMKVVKKRLLSLVLKGKSLENGLSDSKTSVAAVFASSYESAAASVYKFFQALIKDKKLEDQKILGGVDVAKNKALTAADVIFVGKLPPREVLLAQLLGMIAAPIKSLLYVMDQKATRSKEKVVASVN